MNRLQMFLVACTPLYSSLSVGRSVCPSVRNQFAFYRFFDTFLRLSGITAPAQSHATVQPSGIVLLSPKRPSFFMKYINILLFLLIWPQTFLRWSKSRPITLHTCRTHSAIFFYMALIYLPPISSLHPFFYIFNVWLVSFLIVQSAII